MEGLIPRILVAVFTAYLLGNINGAITVSSLIYKDDVRSHGSGNAGVTNYLRSYGMKQTGLVVLIDLGKAILACLVGGMLLDSYGFYLEGTLLGGLFVTLGHDFPACQGFRGGKGILCGLGFSIVADWRVALIILGVFILVTALTRLVSLASCLSSVALGVSFTAFYPGNIRVIALAWIAAILAIFMHRSNIERLIKGTEKKFTLGHHGGEKQ